MFSETGYFEGRQNGLSFAFEVDGVNPFHNIGVQYSMIPMMLSLLNIPINTSNAFGNIMLVGIIPGHGKSEASKLDPYIIDIMVYELLYLSNCKIADAYQKGPVNVKIKVRNHVMGYPGLSKVFNQQGSGRLPGCHWCM